MLSVLVPIYNFDSRTLVKSLSSQCVEAQIEFEIICLDDKSDPKFDSINGEIDQLAGVNYSTLPQNVGRAAIREILAKTAKYSKLLFLDCDVQLVSKSFIKNYLKHFEHKVTVGGIDYHKLPPKNNDYLLRWKYGIEREKLSAQERKNSSFIHFLASNLLIDKKLFLSIPQQKELNGYGHEDTWLGIQLVEKSITINHIDNAVYHIGLDTAQDFLNKSLSGVHNLVRLYASGNPCQDLKLISAFSFFKKLRLINLVNWFLQKRINTIEQNLKGPNPKLTLFDQWKLFHFISYYRKLSLTTRL